MGGLVIKKAFLLAKQDATDRYLVKRICAMYFLATPYSGSDSAKLLSNILNITYSSRAYVSDLKRGSDAIKSINYEFSKHSKDIDLWSFYETQKLNIGVFRVLIVDPDSATLGYRKEKCIPLNADHRSICKFDAPSDPNYILIRNALAVTINSAKSKERLLRSNINDLSEYLDVSDKFEDDLILVQDVRLPGTCEWIKSKESYLQWQDNDPDASRVFWLYGKPASGKSVLSEHLVSLLRTKHDACSFFFFKHGDRSKSQLSTCLRSLAFQMACVNTDIRQLLLEMRERDVKLDGDDDRILWRRLFTSGIFKTDFQQHYWVIDALDECADLVSFFEIVLTRLDRSVPLRILVTSRQTSEIERRIALLGYDQVRVEHISMADTKEDIESFVRARANALIVESEADRAALAEMILGKSEGSWLWTVLVLNELSDSHSEEEIRQVLAEVPKGMEDLYLRTLDLMSQSPRGKRLIKAILVWVTSAMRPLTVKELEEALKLDVNDIFPRLRESISALCGQLVAIDKFDRVQMVHETAREFLLNNSLNSEFAIDQTDAHTRIARACLAYLAGEDMRPPRTNRRSVSRCLADKRSEFSSYASLHFFYHLMKANPLADDLLSLLDKFLKTNKLDHGEAVMFLQFGTKADVLASCGFKKVLVWDIQNGHILYNFEVPVRPIGLAFDEDFLIIPTNKNYLTSWDLNNNGARQPDRPWNDTGGDKCTRSWRVPSVISISFGHRMLAVAYSGRPIALWDLEEDVYYGSCGKKLSDGRTSTHPVTALVFNPNPAIDLLVVSYLDGELVLLNPFDDQTLESRRANCHTLASSADGRLLAGSAGFGAIHIYEFDTLMLLYQVQSSSSCIKQLSFSINSLHCVDIRGSQCNVWEPPVLLRSSASDDTSENSSQSFIGAGATDSKVKISAIAVHYDRDVVLCGRDDGSVSLYDAKSGSRKLEICRHNSSVRILEWWTQRDLAISVDVSNKILAWKVRKSAQGEWVAERMAFQARLVYGGSIIQVLTSEATAKFIISTRGSDHLWQVDGHEENSRRYTDWASVRKWVQHPGSAYHAICFESTAARVYTWDKLSQVVSVSLDISVRALEFKSIKQLVLHSAKGVLVELSEPGGLAKTQNLYLLNAQSFEVDNKASIKHVVTVSPGLDDDLASLSIVEGQGVQEGDSLVSPVEPRLALLSQRVAQVIGICESSRLVFLDTGSWVCSVGLENPTSDITSYIRHFFIPYDWIAGSREVISAVLRQDILFARNDDLVIVRGGFDFTEEIYLQE
ncbi:NACHT and WD domain protein [Aspergillus fischeri NRRL 181]|uniref:WD domain protein n=1 Tax=Neosartorya fischeri (strain ATCC 1020 / DSM 3700 / CBS 544.65 / FGSC A1164 / JCM 1740 / NRRL 181 / WB 181) TaxID=331117 RepID=A1D7V6_NEOFI|nr:WD domain protein [Aspergillus fischeri NRRL 181]EAW21800.1 WD domain protein [Aspergillus fischeri NRRL 181]